MVWEAEPKRGGRRGIYPRAPRASRYELLATWPGHPARVVGSPGYLQYSPGSPGHSCRLTR
jgi:hypothetical protein